MRSRDGSVVSPPLDGLDWLEPSDSALLETLLLEAPVAFAFYDTDLRYRRINRMLAEINHVPMAAHIGRRPSEVLPAALAASVEQRLVEVLQTAQVITEDDVTAPIPVTGETRHYQSQWFPARSESGEIIGVAVLVSDVTERRRSEAALRRSQDHTLKLQHATASLAGALTVEDVARVASDVCRASLSALGAQLLAGQRPATQPEGPGEWRALPLLVSGGQIGTLRVLLPAERGREQGDEVFLEALAGQCAIALERARLYERERRTAMALQRSLLPDRLPVTPGVELAARFRPGSHEADVGGDWYDAFALPDGRLVLVVGDVMGKGVAAAAGMGRLRSALRALAFVDPLPEAVLRGLDRVYVGTEEPDQIATLVYLLVNPAGGRVAVGGAGHLPLIRVRAGAPPQLVDAGSGSTPLGWPEPRVQRTLDLLPGDILLGITDGVVERRGYDLEEGLHKVLEAVAEPDGSLEDLVDRVAETLLGHTTGRDDATLLAVRFVG